MDPVNSATSVKIINTNSSSNVKVEDFFAPAKGRKESFARIFDYLYLIMENKNDRLAVEFSAKDNGADLKPIKVTKETLEFILNGGSVNLIPIGLIRNIEKTKIDDVMSEVDITLKRDVDLKLIIPKNVVQEFFGVKSYVDVKITLKIDSNLSFKYNKIATPADCAIVGWRGMPRMIHDQIWEGYYLFDLKANVKIVSETALLNLFAKGKLEELNVSIKENIENLITIITESGLGYYDILEGKTPDPKKSLIFWSGVLDKENNKIQLQFIWDLSLPIDERVYYATDHQALFNNTFNPGANLELQGFWPLWRLRSELYRLNNWSIVE